VHVCLSLSLSVSVCLSLRLSLSLQVEEQTGAGKQGMHGFYSNLLSKNIAFGGDVQASATSAYTAGSERQQALHRHHDQHDHHDQQQKDAASPPSHPSSSSSSSSPSLSSSSLKRPHDDISQHTAEPKPEAAVAVQEPVQEPVHEPVAVQEPAVVEEQRTAIIQSAKERYLARKKHK
jgi:hypothetical protein